ncbi:helix-turn-helix transcriptional regulator [Microbacterium sp. Sa4CUA7]|uniref:Helix-turn-helix transcriptional regulator n=1 Tax=Microbacterium pullorum TaxID=2762236 RepID=A0ABR8RY00_9MICO|nr:helix-turn-helix transcriptional regulator [Microbacterium pullorum]MBD7956117.1 helix-turn-helix transcriptional regulator [Microbacterium pullorum]
MKPLSRATPATADVLDALLTASEPVWGLQLVKATDRPAGSVYPILERLERLGWAQSEWEDATDRRGPRRRLYRLTDDGAAAAPAAIARARRVRAVRAASVERTAGVIA